MATQLKIMKALNVHMIIFTADDEDSHWGESISNLKGKFGLTQKPTFPLICTFGHISAQDIRR